MKINEQDNIPSISYFPSDEYSSYGSSYDSRGDMYDQNGIIYRQKQQKLSSEQSESNRQSISSQTTLIDEQDNHLFHNRLSPITTNDETILSITSTSPTDQSVTTSTNDYPMRS
jgi:hypothetical protein